MLNKKRQQLTIRRDFFYRAHFLFLFFQETAHGNGMQLMRLAPSNNLHTNKKRRKEERPHNQRRGTINRTTTILRDHFVAFY